jgi:hypothetical protein
MKVLDADVNIPLHVKDERDGKDSKLPDAPTGDEPASTDSLVDLVHECCALCAKLEANAICSECAERLINCKSPGCGKTCDPGDLLDPENSSFTWFRGVFGNASTMYAVCTAHRNLYVHRCGTLGYTDPTSGRLICPKCNPSGIQPPPI